VTTKSCLHATTTDDATEVGNETTVTGIEIERGTGTGTAILDTETLAGGDPVGLLVLGEEIEIEIVETIVSPQMRETRIETGETAPDTGKVTAREKGTARGIKTEAIDGSEIRKLNLRERKTGMMTKYETYNQPRPHGMFSITPAYRQLTFLLHSQ
ncbi:hypothetical protein MPER_01065, partial [Moniliophthora perniciosa FA553]